MLDGKTYFVIISEIRGIRYESCFKQNLKEYNFSRFNINTCPVSCVVNIEQSRFALSKWVSPKRTRSYPFERVYNTLSFSKKITVIPIIKDEGEKGDRDFIQWDTISLMSLFDVYVILAYYDAAEVNPRLEGKITNQLFSNKFIKTKIKEISNYHSSALHWNLDQIKSNLSEIVDKTKKAYKKISDKTGIKMHNVRGVDNFKDDLKEDVNNFMNTSRTKAKGAQHREILTIQPKEVLATLTKAKMTIKNYLGGYYYLTTDEIKIEKRNMYLIEGKHSKNQLLPSINDIKDGLLKMILYCNLSSVFLNKIEYSITPVLSLTSVNIKGSIISNNRKVDIKDFISQNSLSANQVELLNILLEESRKNNFVLEIKKI
ncbi:MAG: hypothetical protein NTV87_13405 [Ignavibacteriae bacterium]|nr:hypothetical protein [Ignavibacteriota bacterium]